MGVVYRATDMTLDRPVALKVLAPNLARDRVFRARFERECRLAAALDHPNVVPIFHAGAERGALYLDDALRRGDRSPGAARGGATTRATSRG